MANNSSTLKKVGAVVVGAILLVAAGFAGHYISPVTITKDVPGPTVTKDVPTDNGNLATVEQFIYNNGDNPDTMGALVNNLDSSQIAQITDRVVFVNELQSLSVNQVKTSDFKQYVSDNSALSVSDIKNLKVNDNADQIAVTDINFGHQSASTEVTGTFKDTSDNKYTYDAFLNFDNNKFVSFESIDVVQE